MSRRVVTLKTPFPRCLIRRPFYKCKSTPCPFCRSMMSKCGLKCVIHTIQKQSNNKMQSTMSTKDRHVVAVASEREEEGGGGLKKDHQLSTFHIVIYVVREKWWPLQRLQNLAYEGHSNTAKSAKVSRQTDSSRQRCGGQHFFFLSSQHLSAP